jgi:hypothetical protein
VQLLSKSVVPVFDATVTSPFAALTARMRHNQLRKPLGEA